MNNVALLILFNHNYEKNITRLKHIYHDRFSNIYFIMPFYQGDDENVISVYENSYYFQGYITQALNQLKGKQFTHYIFIGDDLILNPGINELNYKDFFSISCNEAFIPNFFYLNDLKETKPFRPFAPYWVHQSSAINFKAKQDGIEAATYLPSYQDAEKLLQNQGLNFTPEMPRRMFIPKPIFKQNQSFRNNLKRLKVIVDNFKYLISTPKIPYPFIGSYSDILIVPGRYKDKFILYTGILTALRLFVEIAIPSALAYSVPKVVTEKDLDFKGQTYWGESDFVNLEKKYEGSLDLLFEKFPDKCLYIHPIKLSKWK
jgi:hypothetical protein